MLDHKKLSAAVAVAFLLGAPLAVAAQGDLVVDVTTDATCDVVAFDANIVGGSAPYTVLLEFGDQEFYGELVNVANFQVDHTYPYQGSWEWLISVEDADGMLGEAQGEVVLDGPSASLSSDPFPPLLTIESGEATITFTAQASGGTPPYTYQWDFDGDGLPDAGFEADTASQTYTEGGDYQVTVRVTDGCGFAASETWPVVVVDPEETPLEACHPTALKIAEAVTALFPDQAERLYTCKDIFDIFDGLVFPFRVGFGRMWHAYQLTQTIPDLSWEEIRDWHLNTGGWGLLTQLSRFSQVLDTYEIRDLVELVTSGEQTVQDIRTAIRFVTRFEADFDDALARINEGANPGELGQFYRLVSDLEVEPSMLDEYLADGMTLSELKHSARLAERVGADWTEVAEAKALDDSWGAIGQAFKLADDEYSAEDILAIGVQEYRSLQREQERQVHRRARMQATAERLAERFGLSTEHVMGMYSDCDGKWGCVRKALRQGPSSAVASNRDARMAAKVAAQYEVDEASVWAQWDACDANWNCVRAHFRDLDRQERGKGRNK